MFFLTDENNIFCVVKIHKLSDCFNKYYKIQASKSTLMKCYISVLYIEVPHKSDRKQWSTAKF